MSILKPVSPYLIRLILTFYLRLDVSRAEKISAADIASICQEAGMQAVRKNRYISICTAQYP